MWSKGNNQIFQPSVLWSYIFSPDSEMVPFYQWLNVSTWVNNQSVSYQGQMVAIVYFERGIMFPASEWEERRRCPKSERGERAQYWEYVVNILPGYFKRKHKKKRKRKKNRSARGRGGGEDATFLIQTGLAPTLHHANHRHILRDATSHRKTFRLTHYLILNSKIN